MSQPRCDTIELRTITCSPKDKHKMNVSPLPYHNIGELTGSSLISL